MCLQGKLFVQVFILVLNGQNSADQVKSHQWEHKNHNS